MHLFVLLNDWAAPFRRSVRTAARSLWLHKLRSFLAVTGIIIGTAAVVALMAFGEGSMRDALEDIKRRGATNLFILSVKPVDEATTQEPPPFHRYGLTHDDWHRFQETIPHLVGTLPLRTAPVEIRPLTEGRLFHGRLVATTPSYALVYKLEQFLPRGPYRFLTDRDERMLANVVVLGSEVARELFPAGDPLGKSIKVSGKEQALIVVGVLEDRTPSTHGGDVEQFNRDVYIPLSTWRARFGDRTEIRTTGARLREEVQLSQIVVTVSETEHVRATGEIIKGQLEHFHEQKDWDLKVPLDRLEEAERTRERYRILLGFIAGISLFVGGIGIMNIMLATVTERTREIGIRRALGAKRRHITIQFLVEAMIQTTLGGILGVGLGFAVMFVAPVVYESIWRQRLPVEVPVPSIIMAFWVAVGVGVLFGWYPAQRAALLDPIEALRHE
jgi:putative ABC transport system permease protein